MVNFFRPHVRSHHTTCQWLEMARSARSDRPGAILVKREREREREAKRATKVSDGDDGSFALELKRKKSILIGRSTIEVCDGSNSMGRSRPISRNCHSGGARKKKEVLFSVPLSLLLLLLHVHARRIATRIIPRSTRFVGIPPGLLGLHVQFVGA